MRRGKTMKEGEEKTREKREEEEKKQKKKRVNTLGDLGHYPKENCNAMSLCVFYCV